MSGQDERSRPADNGPAQNSLNTTDDVTRQDDPLHGPGRCVPVMRFAAARRRDERNDEPCGRRCGTCSRCIRAEACVRNRARGWANGDYPGGRVSSSAPVAVAS